jgi:hypothetical protein
VVARRPRLLSLLMVAAVLEMAWTVFLGWSLPRHYVANHWRLAWVGLDVAEIVMLLATAWAAWRRRATLILFATITGTLLVVDAWFDVTTARHGDLLQSVVLAVVVEIPAAGAMFVLSHLAIREVRATRVASPDVAPKSL